MPVNPGDSVKARCHISETVPTAVIPLHTGYFTLSGRVAQSTAH
jgi:hypothetical protein